MEDGWKLKLEEDARTQGGYRITFNGPKDGGERTVALRIPCWAGEDWDIRIHTVHPEGAEADGWQKRMRLQRPPKASRWISTDM